MPPPGAPCGCAGGRPPQSAAQHAYDLDRDNIMRVRTMLRAYAALGDTAAMDQLLARASTMRDAFAEGGGFFIRWRLHWFTDTRPLLGYPPFDRLLQPEG